MTIKYTFALLIAAIPVASLHAQNIGIGTASPHASAILEITSNSKGLLLPRVNLASLNDAATIASPATGLLVFNTNGALTGGTGFYYNSGTPGAPVWEKMGGGSSAGWSLTGNTIDPATHFIGTNNYAPLKFKVSTANSGFIDLASRSTFFGGFAGQNHTFSTNSQSTGFGYEVMQEHVGTLNVGVGAFALRNNQQFGSRNTAVGGEAMFLAQTASRNVALGAHTMYSMVTGSNNIAIGDSAMFGATGVAGNTAIGTNAMRNLGGGSNNIGIGSYALENNTASGNTAVGSSTLRDNTTGNSNAGFGYHALRYNTEGSRNAALGYRALEDNTTGQYNTAMGYASAAANTSGTENTALGYLALSGNLSGDYNVAVGAFTMPSSRASNNIAIGWDAMRLNGISSANIAIGKSALRSMTYTNGGLGWAGWNIAIGTESMYATNPTSNTGGTVTNGVYNTAVGHLTLRENTTGVRNVAIGHEVLRENTTGYWNVAMGMQSMLFNISGNSNVSIGINAMRDNTSGDDNVAVGIASLNGNTSGANNTAVGTGALNQNTTSSNNTAVGSGAGSFNDLNANCTFLGFDADQTTTADLSNSTAIGYLSRITASNQIRLGNASVSSIGGYAPWTDVSDGRFKTDVREDVHGLDFVMQLRPVSYKLDVHGLARQLKEDMSEDKTGKLVSKTVTPATTASRNAASSVLHTGFIAQEVEAAAQKINYRFSGVEKPAEAGGVYGLRYSEFVVPLVKAVQEQQKIIEDLLKRIAILEAGRKE